MNKVQVEILGLSASPSTGGAYALLLKEVYGVRRLPIIIGSFEAQSIALEMEGIKAPRPLTHDLLKSVIEHLGGTVIEVIIDELKDNTFHAKIKIEIASFTHEIDSRPSDAIALAVRTGSPLYVAEEVMRLAAFVPSTEDIEEDTSSEVDEKEEELDKNITKETKLAELQDQLREAIEKEDYERAAKLRDEINKLKGKQN
ncbi:bifunctional nuclease domain-containing protein [Rosettibacter firmus]|uniref:bifunctional nuclease domain-containing protein n=1 Tax=Rosettibacter firmus TaxID=3111522 RepID=UPI00336BF0D1